MTACKKPLCGILAFILVFVFIAAVPVSVFAEDAEETTYSAQEIENNKEKEDDFWYIVTADGSTVEIVGYDGKDKDVSVPSRINSLSVIAVGVGCFEGNKTIETVKLHSDITIIREGAFKNCTSLKEIKNDKSVATIEASAFEGCTSLTEYKIPDTVTDIPEKCFAGCTNLKEIKEHKNLKNVAADAFTGTAWENAKADGPLGFGRVLYSYKGQVKDIVIPKGISIIEDYAFLGCDFIETLTLGVDVEEIGLYAFQNCVNLKTVAVDDAMGILNAGAFKGCSSLQSIDFSESTLATIGYESFADCTSLAEVKLSETLSEIGDFAFANTKIKTIELRKNVNSVNADAFSGVVTLESVSVVDNNKSYTAVDGVLYNESEDNIIVYPAAKKGDFEIPQGVKVISDRAFVNSAASNVTVAEDSALEYIGVSAFENSQVASFTVPANVKTINSAAFKNANKLAKVEFTDGLTYIGASAFEGCTALTAVEFPATLETVANGAFRNCSLTSVKTGDGLAKISAEAFAGNKKLADVKLGANVAKIGVGAFKDCVALKAVVIPASVVDFSGMSFTGCTALSSLTLDAANKAYKAVGSAIYTADGKKLVLAGTGKDTTVVIANGTEVIEANAFELAKNAAAITYPASLTTIKDNALDVTAWYAAQNGVVYAGKVLYKVKGDVANVVVNDGVTTIADGAVNNAAVKTIILPSSLVRIGEGAFAGAGIASVVIPDNVEYIGIGAFKNAADLATVKLPAKLSVLGSGAFSGCAKLVEISLPKDFNVISADTFAGCLALAKVNLGSVEKIEQYAFAGCTALKTITLPATVVECNALAFEGCTALEAIAVDEKNTVYSSLDGVALIANEDGEFNTIAIYPAGKKGAYTVPETVKHIADRAFYNCDALTAITFVEGFESIGAEAFFDCDNIRDIYMVFTATDIGDHAFASCDNLRYFQVVNNLTTYADNAFEGCYYFNYDAVDIDVDDNYGVIIGVIIGVFVVIGVVWYLVYNKKQKKIQKAIQEKTAIAEELAAMEAKKTEETVEK